MTMKTRSDVHGTMAFQDYFSSVSKQYALHRPIYPVELFEWLASIVPGHHLAWDCATGTGQAAIGLATHFNRVIATDASQQQIAATGPHPGITYYAAPAECSGLDDSSADLITVAQALHWFDIERFFREAERVLVPGGVLAVWTYGHLTLDDRRIDSLLQEFYHVAMGPFWPEERKLVDGGYVGIQLPQNELAAPSFCMSASWTRTELIGFIRTWSAVSSYIRKNKDDPVIILEKKIARLWKEPFRMRVSWPLRVKACRIQGSS